MSIPLGTTTHYGGVPLAPLREPCTCPEMPRRPGHNPPACPACRAYQRRQPLPPHAAQCEEAHIDRESQVWYRLPSPA
jgi:hypothetical protein